MEPAIDLFHVGDFGFFLDSRPEALGGECHVLLLEPGSTLNTGNVETEKTRLTLERLD